MKLLAEIDVLWGGYYASQEEGSSGFSVFRLLDFNRYAYHATLFAEKFPRIPSLEEIRALAPFILHVPIDARGLLGAPIQLVGGAPLTGEDLEGYMVYLEHHDVPAKERGELMQRLIGFSNDPPLRLRLEIDDGELLISERD